MSRSVLSRLRLTSLVLLVVISALPTAAAEQYVAAGQSLQQAINQALPGDTITLQAGATFSGNFMLPNKVGTSWITIQSSLVAALPAAGQRVNPSYAPYMAKLMSPNGAAVIATAQGAHHYRFVGLELAAPPGIYTMNVVQLGAGNETTASQLPYAIDFDRVYVHGDPAAGGKRGFTLNSGNTIIRNSWISNFKSTSQDAQAIAGWNGTGPYEITNNYLEASTENIMFGGAVPTIPNLVPSDIRILRNHFFKPLSWKQGDPTFAGTTWIVKNLFELKNARRVTVQGNVFENCWAQAQAGFGVQLTVRTENGRAPWAVVEDVTFDRNIFRNMGHGINVLGRDGSYGGAARRITLRNNLFTDIAGRWLQLLNGSNYVTADHNTVFHGALLVSLDGTPSYGFVFRNNVSGRGTYGIFGSGKQEGNLTLAYYTPSAVVTKNLIGGASASLYPTGNYFPNSVYDARFVDAFGGNYTLAADSPYRLLGTDGKDLGVDFVALTLATTGVVTR